MTIRARTYDILARAVEEGVAAGQYRAMKHLGEGIAPTDEALREHIEREVLNAICEVFAFEEVGGE